MPFDLSVGKAQISNSGEMENEKFLVDLKGLNALWLQCAGVPEEQITVSDACTSCRQDLFWSHRHTGDARGVMAAVIQLI